MKLTKREKWLMKAAARRAFGFPNEIYDDWLKENEQRLASEAPSNWIPVSERLPDSKTEVMVHRKDRGFWWGVLVKDNWYTRFGYGWDNVDDVTHWMPLPEKPTGEDDGQD